MQPIDEEKLPRNYYAIISLNMLFHSRIGNGYEMSKKSLNVLERFSGESNSSR